MDIDSPMKSPKIPPLKLSEVSFRTIYLAGKLCPCLWFSLDQDSSNDLNYKQNLKNIESKYKSQSYKTLEGNIRVNLHNLRFGNRILDMTAKAQQQKNT